jgi:hypothetical protein
MSILTTKSSMELNSWKEKLTDFSGKPVGERVKEVLCSINNYDRSSLNDDEYFQVLAKQFNSLTGVKLHTNDLEGN